MGKAVVGTDEALTALIRVLKYSAAEAVDIIDGVYLACPDLATELDIDLSSAGATIHDAYDGDNNNNNNTNNNDDNATVVLQLVDSLNRELLSIGYTIPQINGILSGGAVERVLSAHRSSHRGRTRGTRRQTGTRLYNFIHTTPTPAVQDQSATSPSLSLLQDDDVRPGSAARVNLEARFASIRQERTDLLNTPPATPPGV